MGAALMVAANAVRNLVLFFVRSIAFFAAIAAISILGSRRAGASLADADLNLLSGGL
jgi:hypothetical protein